MLDIGISIITSMMLILLSASIIRYPLLIQERDLKVLIPQTKKHYLFAFGMIFSIVLINASSLMLYKLSWIDCVNRLIIVSFLWVISLIDFRKHIIPNKLLLILLSLRTVIAIFQIVFYSNAKTELLSSLLASIGVVLLFCLMRFLVKDGIGFGDVKLFGVIGLYFGIKGTLSVVFFSFAASFVVSVYMLLTKKKSKKDYLAFAPSILIGTIVAVVVFGA